MHIAIVVTCAIYVTGVCGHGCVTPGAYRLGRSRRLAISYFPRSTSRRMARIQRLELRWYSDWRWRVASDRAGLVLWCGPVAVYLWRSTERVGSRPRWHGPT